jgi:regulation of enolase protein 1 (concanavalin A-like superfamily)
MVRSKAVSVLLVSVLFVTAAFARQGAGNLPGWGDPVDPDRDCEIRVVEKALVIKVPGTPHVLRAAAGQRNAPRVLRDIEGNFTAQVKVLATFATGVASQGAGLLLWQDERNFVLLERTADDAGIRFEYWRDGQLQGGDPVPNTAPEPGSATWLRLTRHISTLKAEVSQDGETWTELKSVPIRLSSRMRLGVVATNSSERPLEARFEAFQVKSIPLYPTDR